MAESEQRRPCRTFNRSRGTRAALAPASGDACFIARCGCDGQTIEGCDFTTKPFSFTGACDGGTDSGVDATPDDGGECLPPNVWRYQTAGCGADAHPVCGSASGDACFIARCGCDGQTIDGCDFTTKPFSFTGACDGGSDGGDAASD
jgi:hypothetical protein